MQATRPGIRIHRAPRRWPHVPSDAMTIQAIQPPNKPSNTTILVTVASMIGLLLAAVIYSQSGGGSSSTLMLGFLAISGLSMVASLMTFFVQRQTAGAEARDLVKRYTGYLNEREQTIGALSAEEHEFRIGNDLATPEIIATLTRHPERAWQRQPDDPDFLTVRVGAGDAPSWLKVELADNATPFAPLAKDAAIRDQQQHAHAIAEQYQLARDVPLTAALREHASVALINGGPGVAGASDLARSMVAQVASHHPPSEVQIAVFAPTALASRWAWLPEMPTAGLDWQGLAGHAEERQQRISVLLAELNRRHQAQHERESYQHRSGSPLPHLLIVVDAFSESGESDPLSTPALALALSEGKSLGATVVTVHSARQQAPSQATLAVDVTRRRIIPLGPNPSATIPCAAIDGFDLALGAAIAQALKPLELEAQATLEVPARVRLLPLLDPPIHRPEDYPIADRWQSVAQRHKQMGDGRAFVIPLGRKIGQEPVNLDFVADGPHGLLIGQTGSGKSEMLRSIIAALAIQYPPDMVNFVLVDYKGGLAFDVFEHLPHTVAYLTNMVAPGQTTRFLEMLEAEIVRRQAARSSQQPMPELFVIIDEFAEMVSRRSGNDANEAVLDSLLSIARLGRELGVHLLFAAQRPEGGVIQRLRGYVQYRICLRTNTPEDSREVINAPDAAQLPVEIPGRGYLLRGDNELSLFQAARIHVPSFQSGKIHLSRTSLNLTQGGFEKTADTIIAERMRHLPDSRVATRWPTPLPTPSHLEPTPLAFVAAISTPTGTITWNPAQHASLRKMEIPLGLFDRPAEQRQDWFVVDLVGYAGRMQGGPLLVMGDLNAGKTTTLQTLLLFLASTHDPKDLRWFVLNPNSSLSEFGALPHVVDVDSAQSRTRNVIDGLDDTAFREFQGRFERAVQKDASTRPALLLVIDDYDELAAKHGKALHDLANLAIRSRERAVYFVVSVSRPSYDLPQTLITSMATRIVLYMNDRDQLRSVISGRVPGALDAIPGRGLAQTRRSLDTIQIAVPVAGKDDMERMRQLDAGINQLAQRWQP